MAQQDIIQNMISRLGQSQDDRPPRELAAHFVDVDEREPQDQLLFLAKFARLVSYYHDDITTAAGDWSAFLPQFPHDPREAARLATRLLEDDRGTLAPHLALLLAFLKLYEIPRDAINRITGTHLDFFYQQVLRFEKCAAIPDRAHVLVNLKKNAPALAIRPQDLFSAGKDGTGAQLLFAPTRETIVSGAAVDSLRSVFLDRRGRGTVRFAAIANSEDGLGSELKREEPKWSGFGHSGLPPAELGFAIGSPVLRMKEGDRTVTLSLRVDGLEDGALDAGALADAFDAYLTGEKSWLGPYALTGALAEAGELRLQLQIPATEKAVVDYNSAVHGYAYAAQAPVVQLLLRAEGAVGYLDVRTLTLRRARVSVRVQGVTTLTLESDVGTLDPKKAFLPFGPQPVVGSRFMVGCVEALSKKLSELSVQVRWHGAPASFAEHYGHYTPLVSDDGYFTADVSFQDGGSWQRTLPPVKMFESRSPDGTRSLSFTPGSASTASAAARGGTASAHLYGLEVAGSEWAARRARRYVLARPVLAPAAAAPPELRPGFIVFSLKKDFLHANYRQQTVENALTYGRSRGGLTVLKEPYTPAIQGISLSYSADSDDVSLAASSPDDASALESFSNPDLQFFHVGCFGQMREHGYQRQQFAFVHDKDVPLLPVYEAAGELLVGLRNLGAGDSVSLLFQVAEGSADPDLPRQDVAWFVLCDGYWKPLGNAEVVRDTTNHLLASGIIQFVIPAEATTGNTILPKGPIWLKATVADHVGAVCQLIEVAANAVEVQFQEAGNDPLRLATPLEKGKITKLKSALPTVRAVAQPFASFGGSPVESTEALRVRAAERLRHKNRCVTAWDYERIVLGAFPGVHTVKCIPHTKDDAWLAPGNVLLVLIPDLRHSNARDPLQPKVDADTINRVRVQVQLHCGMQVVVHVRNPKYQQIKLDFAVQFRSGNESNYYSAQLNRELIRFLSPWAYEIERPLAFGGRVFRSVLLDFVEKRDYVDYVTDFKMYSYTGALSQQDVPEARPETPDAILVSASAHTIRDVRRP